MTRKPDLEWLKISPEVAFYLDSRGIPLPDCPPKVKTPEPGDVEGAVFDPERVDKVLAAFRALRHTQGQWAGQPLVPDPWQVAYIIAPTFGWVRWDEEAQQHLRIITDLYVDVPRKNGKALSLDTPILTGRGWVTMGDVSVGDAVHGADGHLTEVVATSEIFTDHDCYEVEFSDGRKVTADAGHLWTVFDRYRKRTLTVDTETMAGAYLIGNRETHRERRYSIPVNAPVARPEVDLPIAPYLLGAWLGDGHTDAARITGIDPEIIDRFREHYEVHEVVPAVTWSVVGGFLVALREAGVLGNKHIPESYLTASEGQRLELLRGLMDTDGSVFMTSGTPRCEFTATNRTLAVAVLQLARSLGWKATLIEGVATLGGREISPKYRVTWNAYRDRSPFMLPRKTARLSERPMKPARSSTVQVVGVRRVPTVPTRCIQVAAGDGLYLAGDGFLTTHNSTLAGGLAIYLTCADGEPGAQVIAAATSERQAGFVFQPVKQLAQKSPALKSNVKAYQKKIVHPRSGSYFEAIANVADAQHGANVHGAIIDELHIHKAPELVETIETGRGSRRQPLVVIITTADDGKPNTIYERRRQRVEAAASGTINAPHVYGVIWAADPKDDPFVEATWRVANPGYGVSPTARYLATKAADAKQSPADLAAFLRLHLGLRTKQSTKYVTLEEWRRNAGQIDEATLNGRVAFGGLDLGNVADLTALCWLFPDGTGYDALWRFWLPEDRVDHLSRRTAGGIRLWIDQGWVVTTPGATTDYDYVLAQIREDRKAFKVRQIGFDPWNANQLTKQLLAERAPLVEVRQGYKSMSPPLKEIKRLLAAGTAEVPLLRSGENPVMPWMTDNLAVAMDPSGNVKPDKSTAADKIDGWSALVTAMSRAMHFRARRSAYAEESA